MPRTVVLLSGGLVNSRKPNPSEGELEEAVACHYLPGSPDLRKNLGRKRYTAAGIAGVGTGTGLRFLKYSGDTGIAAVQRDGKLYLSTLSALTGTATLALSSFAGDHLAAVRYKNENYLFDGLTRNQIVKSDKSVREHGIPEQSAPTLTLSAGAGPAAGTYDYWITGFDSATGIEGAAAAATSVTPSGGQTVTVTRPTLQGARLTHWRVYRSTGAAGVVFPNGNRIDGTGNGIAAATSSLADTGLTAGITYPIVTVSFAGQSVAVSKNGRPPIADFGVRIDDCLVTNDVSDTTLMRYSFPGEPEVFPSQFFTDVFDDEVKSGLGFGTFGVVFTDSMTWRLNSVSIAQDAEFARGRLADLICQWFGCPSPLGCTHFETPEGPMAAFYSRSGLMITDGQNWDRATDDADWSLLVAPSEAGKVVLVNDPDNHWLELYGTSPAGGPGLSRIRLSYDPFHRKGRGGRGAGLKIMSVDPVAWGGADAALMAGAWEVLTLGLSDGHVYRENVGDADDSGGPAMSLRVRSARHLMGGPGGEGTATQAWLDHGSTPGASVSVQFRSHADRRAPIDHKAVSVPVTEDGRTSLQPNVSGAEFDVLLTNSASGQPIVLRDLTVQYDEMGAEEGGRV